MARRAASQGSEMTTQRAPYITRRWTETEVAALRSMGEAGKDARSTSVKNFTGLLWASKRRPRN
jgi:hypothetical protein